MELANECGQGAGAHAYLSSVHGESHRVRRSSSPVRGRRRWLADPKVHVPCGGGRGRCRGELVHVHVGVEPPPSVERPGLRVRLCACHCGCHVGAPEPARHHHITHHACETGAVTLGVRGGLHDLWGRIVSNVTADDCDERSKGAGERSEPQEGLRSFESVSYGPFCDPPPRHRCRSPAFISSVLTLLALAHYCCLETFKVLGRVNRDMRPEARRGGGGVEDEGRRRCVREGQGEGRSRNTVRFQCLRCIGTSPTAKATHASERPPSLLL